MTKLAAVLNREGDMTKQTAVLNREGDMTKQAAVPNREGSRARQAAGLVRPAGLRAPAWRARRVLEWWVGGVAALKPDVELR